MSSSSPSWLLRSYGHTPGDLLGLHNWGNLCGCFQLTLMLSEYLYCNITTEENVPCGDAKVLPREQEAASPVIEEPTDATTVSTRALRQGDWLCHHAFGNQKIALRG